MQIEKEKRVLVFDPGESTGWMLGNFAGDIIDGGTDIKGHSGIADLILQHSPEIVVCERFHLFPGAAKSFSWSTFYPCEIIGVIRYMCEEHGITLVEQNPSIKRYAGGFQKDWTEFKARNITTEHTKDAYLHLKYFYKFNFTKSRKVQE